MRTAVSSGHQRGACRVEAETGELIEPPDARLKLLGLTWLDLGLDPLDLVHDTSKDRRTDPAGHGPSGPFGTSGRHSFVHPLVSRIGGTATAASVGRNQEA